MTAFSLPNLPDPFKVQPIETGEDLDIRPPRKVREVATDSIIKANRAQTPPEVQDQRSAKRMSIGEMNALDMPTLMERYQAQRYDDRGAVTRFLDMLDMPRNVIASTLFPSIRRRKEAEGDTGTFGLGNVRFSDILDELGVDNRIIKGVAGFVGDVAMDPLTYLGPAGWGGKIVGTGGKTVEFTAEGRRALNAAVKAAARGQAVQDVHAAGVLKAFGFGEDTLAASRGTKSAAQIEREIKAGIYGSQSKLSKVGELLGMDLQGSGSKFADAFHSTEETAQSIAARDFVKQYGRASAKGYQIGTGFVGAGTGKAAGSYIAHIPFTSYGLFVPAFTGEAAHAAAMLAQANAGFLKQTAPLGEDVGFFNQPLQDLKDLQNEVPNIQNRAAEIRTVHMPAAEEVKAGVEDGFNQLNETRKAARERYRTAQQNYRDARRAHIDAAATADAGPVAIGQQVQWTGQGVGQFAEPRTVEAFHLAPDNTLYAKLSGSDTMVPMSELHPWGAASPGEVDQLGKVRASAKDIRNKHRLEYRKARDDVNAARPAYEARHDPINALRDEANNLASRQHEIDRPGGLRDQAVEKARSIVQAVDPHNPTGGVIEGLNASRAQNQLNSIAEVLHQKNQLVAKVSDASLLLKENAEMLDAVEERKRILSALGPEMDAEVADGMERARKEWSETRGGLFDPMPEMNADEHALAYAESGETAANKVKAAHEANLREWEKRNRFAADEIRQDLREKALAKRVGALEPAQQELLNWSPKKVTQMESLADLVQSEFQLRMAQAEAIEGTLVEAAKNTSNKELAYIAKDMMGLGGTVGGYSMFTSVRNIGKMLFGDTNTATQYAFGKYDAMTEVMRSIFGGGKGEAHRLMRIMESQAAARRELAATAKIKEFRKDVMDALEKAGISSDRFPEAERVLFPMMILRMDPEGKAWSLHNSEIEQAIMDAKNAGLGPAFENLTAVGDKHIDLLRAMTDDEFESGVLNAYRDKYLPSTLTAEGREALGSMAETGGFTKPSIPGGDPEFTKPLVTTRATWQSVRDGETKQMYRFKYDFFNGFLTENGDLSDIGRQRLMSMAHDSGLRGGHAGNVGFNVEFWDKWANNRAAITAEDVSRLSQFEQNIVKAADYNALPSAEKLTTSSFKMVDPITKNRDLPAEFAAMNPGVSMPRGLYEESLAETMARRAGSHEFATIRKQFSEIMAGYAQAVPKAAVQDISRLKTGDQIPFTNGAIGTVVKSGGDFVLEVGGEKYRRVKDVAKIQESLERLGSGMYKSSDIDIVYPVPVAEALERLADVESKPGTVLHVYDQFLRYWKGTTLAHLSWVVGDVIGGVFQMLMMGVSPTKAIGRMKDGIRLAMAQDKAAMLKELLVDAHGMSAEELVQRASQMGVLSGHVHGEPFIKLIENGVYLPPYSQSMMSADTLKNPMGFVKTRWSEMRQRAQRLVEVDNANQIWAKIPHHEKISKAWRFGVDEGFMNHFAAPWWALNGRANDAIRMTSLLALMDDGHDFAGAAHKVLNGLFDVSDLTGVERRWFKRLIPFYAWMKHSGLYWTQRMMQNPALLSVAPRAKRAIEESLYGDSTVPEYLRPNWMRDQMALQIGFNPDSRYATTLGTLLPTETATAVGGAAASPFIGALGAKQLLENVGFGLTVPLKMLMEGASGRELFSGREIGFNPNQGDLTVGEYLAGQVRPFRELGIGNIRQGPIQKAASAGAIPLASRIALGGRSQPFDDERIRQNNAREFKQNEQSIRKRITIAEREGNKSASLNARAALMKLYAEAQAKGLNDMIPAWAREQLPVVAGG